MHSDTTTPAGGPAVLPAYVGLVLLGFVLALLTVIVLTEAGGAMRQAETAGAAVFVLSALPYLSYLVVTRWGGDADE